MAETRPPVVLIPSQLCTEDLWMPQIPALEKLADVRVAVQRDHDNVGAMADALLQSLPPRFSIMGHAFGGFVAFEILRRAPGRVASLALLSSLARNDTPKQTARREGYLRLVEAGNFDGIIEERIPMLLHPDHVKDAALVAIVRKMAADTGAEAFLNQQRAIMARPDSRPSLGAISCPTLILYARQDGIATMEHQQEMLDGIPGPRFEIIEDSGHMMTLEQPDAVTQILCDWIAKT